MRFKSLSLAALMLAGASFVASPAPAETARPTIVLVHGAFAGSESWEPVSAILRKDGYNVIALANPLRSLSGDTAYVHAQTAAISGPIVLVGHSYGGALISGAANGLSNVKALVYVGAFAPEKGETILELSGKFPGSTLGPSLAAPVKLPDGTVDLKIDPAKFHEQFAADVPQDKAALMAEIQRPITDKAIGEKAGDAAWHDIPSWHIFGTGDRNIPAAAMKFMAERAHAKQTVIIEGASHVPMLTHPHEVASLIEDAAKAQ